MAWPGDWPGPGGGVCREGQGGGALECTYWSATRTVGTGRDLHQDQGHPACSGRPSRDNGGATACCVSVALLVRDWSRGDTRHAVAVPRAAGWGS